MKAVVRPNALQYVCPSCRTGVTEAPTAYDCPACRRSFPVLFGIPDFRVRPDRYLSIEDERSKAARLYEFGQSARFEELIDFYYSITDDVPPALARSFGRYVRNGPVRAASILTQLVDSCDERALLDLGCGSGGMLIAGAAKYEHVVGVDIGLRWLVIAQKRLAEAEIAATLVCADVEALPFPDRSFSLVTADDLIEHAYDPYAAVGAAARQVRPGGQMWLSAINRFWIGPHPAVGVWASGFLPRPVRSRVVRMLRGVDGLRNMGFVSPRAVMRHCLRAGLEPIAARARPIDANNSEGRSSIFHIAAAIHRTVGATPLLASLLLWLGPTFEVAVRRSADTGSK